ncbi:DedA family protein [Pseudonocardia phyllosphaerae]|uniref:DedA family protein n=1 Tax=Pseudonocardia phyllosphaerae TaxID=3390502 RepID=UPI00397804A4
MTGAPPEPERPEKELPEKELSEKERRRAEAAQAWRDVVPWDGPPQRADKILLALVIGVPLLMLGTIPLRPMLIANHPVLLEFVTGSLSAVGAGAAFARVGQLPLWLVVVAGVVGMIKIDWLFWLAGRRWGEKVITMFAPPGRGQRFVARVRSLRPALLAVAVAATALPGVPAAPVFALAGLNRMRLATFLVADACGAAVVVGLVAWLGYAIGQPAVDLVMLVNSYSLWISVGLVVVVSVLSGRRASRQARS